VAGSARHVGSDEVASVVSHGKVAITVGSAKLSRVVVIVGLKGQDKGICAMHVSGKGIKPTHHPCAKGKCSVNPVFGVISLFFTQSRLAS